MQPLAVRTGYNALGPQHLAIIAGIQGFQRGSQLLLPVGVGGLFTPAGKYLIGMVMMVMVVMFMAAAAALIVILIVMVVMLMLVVMVMAAAGAVLAVLMMMVMLVMMLMLLVVMVVMMFMGFVSNFCKQFFFQRLAGFHCLQNLFTRELLDRCCDDWSFFIQFS